MIFSKEIVKKCAYDPELKRIIYYIASLTSEKRDEFKKKLNLYFMNKNTEDDVEAFKFYKLLIDSDNAVKLKDEIEGLTNEK